MSRFSSFGGSCGPEPEAVGSARFSHGDLGEPVGVDANGCPTERLTIGDIDVVVHYDDIPETDITTVKGIRCTTALRTVIDIAPEIDDEDLNRIVVNCLQRDLFTLEEAWRRLSEPDMATRPGARRLRRLLPTVS